jgi:hypothetical protein
MVEQEAYGYVACAHVKYMIIKRIKTNSASYAALPFLNPQVLACFVQAHQQNLTRI